MRVFTLRPELVDAWESTIFVHTDFDVALKRAEHRERDHFGDIESVRRTYQQRYIPGQQYYLDTIKPHKTAHVWVDNNDPANPTMSINRITAE